MQLLNEIDRIKSVMGVMTEDKNSPKHLNINLSKSVEALRYLKIYNPTIERMLIEITNLAKEQIIDFGLLERGLRKVLLKKGDKKRNVSDYFGKIISSLKFREKKGYGVEPDAEDYEFDFDEEPSIVPKKVYKKEMKKETKKELRSQKKIGLNTQYNYIIPEIIRNTETQINNFE